MAAVAHTQLDEVEQQNAHCAYMPAHFADNSRVVVRADSTGEYVLEIGNGQVDAMGNKEPVDLILSLEDCHNTAAAAAAVPVGWGSCDIADSHGTDLDRPLAAVVEFRSILFNELHFRLDHCSL